MTLFDLLTKWRDQRMQELEKPYDYVETEINRLTNYDFLQEISDALETLLAERK